MVATRSLRLYAYLTLSVIIVLVLLYLPTTSLPARSQEYVQGLVTGSKDWRLFGEGPSTGPSGEDGTDQDTATSTGPPADESHYTVETAEEGYWFLADLPNPPPQFDIAKLRTFSPHNYRGPGHDTFATYFASRNSSLQDPYFIAAQEIVFRLLWDPKSRSKEHPVTVFVAPFISDEQRGYFAAAGAVVRELDLIPFQPSGTAPGRLMDVFSKLEMWNQTEFKRIVYLDSDALPLKNIDSLLKGPEQTCKRKLLPEIDRETPEICNYVFRGWRENEHSINAGVLVLKPSEAMYSRLIRECHNATNFENSMMEQALLNYAFRPSGPFPPATFGEEYNASPSYKESKVNIVHTKLWAMVFNEPHWAANLFNDTWTDLLGYYESEDFPRMRIRDGVHALHALGDTAT